MIMMMMTMLKIMMMMMMASSMLLETFVMVELLKKAKRQRTYRVIPRSLTDYHLQSRLDYGSHYVGYI